MYYFNNYFYIFDISIWQTLKRITSIYTIAINKSITFLLINYNIQNFNQ